MIRYTFAFAVLTWIALVGNMAVHKCDGPEACVEVPRPVQVGK